MLAEASIITPGTSGTTTIRTTTPSNTTESSAYADTGTPQPTFIHAPSTFVGNSSQLVFEYFLLIGLFAYINSIFFSHENG